MHAFKVNVAKLMNINDRVYEFQQRKILFLCLGPDICGPGTKKVHVIFRYKGKNLLIKKDIRCKVWVIVCCIYTTLRKCLLITSAFLLDTYQKTVLLRNCTR